MRIIVKPANENPEVVNVENELKVFQELVGGYIEVVRLDDVLLICNEEGKLNGLPPNFKLGHDVIVGTAVFVADGKDGEFAGLDDFQLDTVMSYFY